MHSSDSLNRVPVTIVVPGTTKIAAATYPHTVRIAPDNTNGLRMVTVFLAFQIQAADSRWIQQPSMGKLSADHLVEVEDAVLAALGFDAPEN